MYIVEPFYGYNCFELLELFWCVWITIHIYFTLSLCSRPWHLTNKWWFRHVTKPVYVLCDYKVNHGDIGLGDRSGKTSVNKNRKWGKISYKYLNFRYRPCLGMDKFIMMLADAQAPSSARPSTCKMLTTNLVMISWNFFIIIVYVSVHRSNTFILMAIDISRAFCDLKRLKNQAERRINRWHSPQYFRLHRNTVFKCAMDFIYGLKGMSNISGKHIAFRILFLKLPRLSTT